MRLGGLSRATVTSFFTEGRKAAMRTLPPCTLCTYKLTEPITPSANTGWREPRRREGGGREGPRSPQMRLHVLRSALAVSLQTCTEEAAGDCITARVFIVDFLKSQ